MSGGRMKRSPRMEPKPLDNTLISVSSIATSLRRDVASAIEQLGGKYSPSLDVSCTHLIVDNTMFREGPKYQFAKHKGIEIVTLNWLRDCVEKRIRFNEDDYRPETLKKQQQKQKQKQKQQQQQHQQQQQQQQQNREANGTILDLSEISAPSDVAPNDDEDGISISSTVKVQKRTRTSDSGNKGKEEKVLTPPESKKKKNKKRKNPFEDFLFIHDGFEEDDQVALSNEIERRGGRVMNFRKGMEIVEKRRSSSTKGKFFQQSSWEPLYLVCPHGHSLALDNYPIVTPSWVERCSMSSSLLDIKSNPIFSPLPFPYPLRSLQDYTVYLEGFSKQKFDLMRNILVTSGAHITRKFPKANVILCSQETLTEWKSRQTGETDDMIDDESLNQQEQGKKKRKRIEPPPQVSRKDRKTDDLEEPKKNILSRALEIPLPIVDEQWVLESLYSERKVPIPSFETLLTSKKRSEAAQEIGEREIFDGFTFFLPMQRLENASRLYSLSGQLGAEITLEPFSCTHYIHQGPPKRTKDYLAAKESGAMIVSPLWIWECARQGQRLPESLFPPEVRAGRTLGSVIESKATTRKVPERKKDEAIKSAPQRAIGKKEEVRKTPGPILIHRGDSFSLSNKPTPTTKQTPSSFVESKPTHQNSFSSTSHHLLPVAQAILQPFSPIQKVHSPTPPGEPTTTGILDEREHNHEEDSEHNHDDPDQIAPNKSQEMRSTVAAFEELQRLLKSKPSRKGTTGTRIKPKSSIRLRSVSRESDSSEKETEDAKNDSENDHNMVTLKTKEDRKSQSPVPSVVYVDPMEAAARAELDGHDHKEGTQSEKMDLEEDSWAKEEKTPLSFSSSSLPVASLSPDSCTFTLTGFDTGVAEKWVPLIRRLGGKYEKQASPAVTIVIANKLSKTEKVIGGLAKGAWILMESYLEACEKCEGFPDPEKYQFCSSSSDQIAIAANYWRKTLFGNSTQGKRKEQNVEGAFAHVRAMFHGRGSGTARSFQNIIRIGGGKILKYRDFETIDFRDPLNMPTHIFFVEKLGEKERRERRRLPTDNSDPPLGLIVERWEDNRVFCGSYFTIYNYLLSLGVSWD